MNGPRIRIAPIVALLVFLTFISVLAYELGYAYAMSFINGD